MLKWALGSMLLATTGFLSAVALATEAAKGDPAAKTSDCQLILEGRHIERLALVDEQGRSVVLAHPDSPAARELHAKRDKDFEGFNFREIEKMIMLQMIDKESAAKVQLIIDRHDENILLYSTQQYIKYPEATAVSEVISQFHVFARDMDVIMYVYVTGENDVLKGVVDFRELMAATPQQTLKDIMTENALSLSPDDTLSDAVAMFDRYIFRAIPVTDDDNHLLAVVSFRDIHGIKPRLD